MKKSKSKKTARITIMAVSLVWFISLAAIGTYTWIARNWTPTLEYPEITIATSGALVISMKEKDGNEAEYNEVNLNEYAGLTDGYTLKQVSSCDGRTFVGADFSPVLRNEVPVYSKEVDGKYIELEFFLKAQFMNDESLYNEKEVFLHPETEIKYLPPQVNESESSEEQTSVDVDPLLAAKVEQSIRMSIEVPPPFNNGNPYILLKRRSDAEETKFKYDDLQASATTNYSFVIGKPIFESFYENNTKLNSKILSNQVCYDYKYFDGSTDSKVMFKVNQGSMLTVKLRIWLEGCDPNCVSEIAGESLKIVIKFDSRDVNNPNLNS